MADQHEIDAAFDGIFEVNDGVNEQEPADPAPEEEETSAQADEDNAEGDDTGNGAGQQEPTEPAEQTAAENAKYAAARRKAERQAAREIERVREEEAQKYAARMDTDIAEMGLLNPYTGKQIRSRADLAEYKEMHTREQQRIATEKMDDSGLSEAERRALVESDPQYIEAMKLKTELEALRKKTNDMEAQQLKERADARLAAGIAAINEEDPSITSVQDLFEHPKWKDIDGLVRKGLSIEQAYKTVNQDEIIQRKAEAMAAQMRNNIAGKSHMGTTIPRGDGGVVVPADVRAEFLSLNPDATDERISAYYAKYKASLKK